MSKLVPQTMTVDEHNVAIDLQEEIQKLKAQLAIATKALKQIAYKPEGHLSSHDKVARDTLSRIALTPHAVVESTSWDEGNGLWRSGERTGDSLIGESYWPSTTIVWEKE